MIREWFGLESFDSNQRTVNALLGSFGIEPLSSGLPWPLQRFYSNKLFSCRRKDACTKLIKRNIYTVKKDVLPDVRYNS